MTWSVWISNSNYLTLSDYFFNHLKIVPYRIRRSYWEHCLTNHKYISPERKRTIAFRQANSAGSTPTALNRSSVSFRIRMSVATWLSLPFGTPAAWSDTEKRGLDSRGMHHWTAFSRKSSAHASSRRITWKERNSIELTSTFIRRSRRF